MYTEHASAIALVNRYDSSCLSSWWKWHGKEPWILQILTGLAHMLYPESSQIRHACAGLTAAVPNQAGFLSPGSIFLVSGDNVNMTITGNFINVVTNNISPFITVTAGYTVVFQNCLFQNNIGELASSQMRKFPNICWPSVRLGLHLMHLTKMNVLFQDAAWDPGSKLTHPEAFSSVSSVVQMQAKLMVECHTLS